MSKSKNKENRQKVLGAVASIQTLLENYPALLTTDTDSQNNSSVNISVSFLTALLAMLNITQEDIAAWMARLLSGKSSDGLLNSIEEVIKATLLVNIKSLFTCSADPLISDDILYEYTDINNNPAKGRGLEIDLDMADMMGILSHCPLSQDGKSFYFDNDTIENISDLWKSRDFNAFLWYVINRADNNTTDAAVRARTWDNRCKYFKSKDFTTDSDFFSLTGDTGSDITKYIICKYQERLENTTKPTNVLKFYLNAGRYRKKFLNIEINRTIFEFNYDYIYSLKLFDSKTLTAQIINAVLGLTSTVSVGVSIQKRLVEEKIHEVVRRIMAADDEESNDSGGYFKFSNDEYNTLLEKATAKYNGKYQIGNNEAIDIPFDAINEAIEKINTSTNTDDEIDNIKSAFYAAANTIANSSNNTNIGAQFGMACNVNASIIESFIEELSTQLVLCLLSPKVSILYAVNAYILKGTVDDLSSWENFMSTFGNLIKSIIEKIKEIIIQQLYAFAMEQLKPLMELYVSKLLLETIRDYKDLLNNLRRLCLLDSSSNNSSSLVHLIDNVDYADIITEKNNP